MDSSKPQLIPTWVTQPDKLLNALAFSEYFNDSFTNTTSLPDQTLFGKSITQFLYWKRRLAPSLTPYTVIFALLGSEGLATLNVMDVIMGVKEACNMLGAFEFYQAANPKFIGISFTTSVDMADFTQRFKFFKNHVVAYVQPPSDQSRNFSILWLPPLFNINRVRTLLNKYCKHATMQNGTVKAGPNSYMRSSVVRGTITIRDDISLEDIPHLIPLPSPHNGHALLIITGREPFCLKCLTRGHLRKDCQIIKCNTCNFHHSSESICEVSTYAKRVAGTSTIGEQYCWPEDVVGEEELELTSPTASTTHSLSDRHNSKTSTTKQHSGALLSTSFSDTHNLSNLNENPDIHSPSTVTQESPPQKCDHTFPLSTAFTLPCKDISSTSQDNTHTSVPTSVLTNPSRKNTITSRQASKEDTMGQSTPTDLTPSGPAPVAVATYSRTPNFSKVRITAEHPNTTSTPRSLIIPYNSFQQAFVDSNQQDLLPSAIAEMDSLFQDTEDCYNSSDSDTSSDHVMSLDSPDPSFSKSLSRKRKGSSSSSLFHKTISPVTIPSTSEDTNFDPAIASTDTLTVNIQTPSALSITAMASPHSTNRSKLFEQVASLLNITDDQVSLLVDLCPKGQLTPDTLKALKLLSTHGFDYAQIIGSPHILKLKHLELKRKFKYLTSHLGVFTLDDIWAQDKIEGKLDSGGKITPSGAFHDV